MTDVPTPLLSPSGNGDVGGLGSPSAASIFSGVSGVSGVVSEDRGSAESASPLSDVDGFLASIDADTAEDGAGVSAGSGVVSPSGGSGVVSPSGGSGVRFKAVKAGVSPHTLPPMPEATPLPAAEGSSVLALYDFDAASVKALWPKAGAQPMSLTCGEELYVVDRAGDWILGQRTSGETGYFPENYVKVAEPAASCAQAAAR